MDTHTRPYDCRKCQKRFARKFTLDEHIKSVHQGRIFNCYFCPRSYKCKKALAKHRENKHPRNSAREITKEEVKKFEKYETIEDYDFDDNEDEEDTDIEQDWGLESDGDDNEDEEDTAIEHDWGL